MTGSVELGPIHITRPNETDNLWQTHLARVTTKLLQSVAHGGEVHYCRYTTAGKKAVPVLLFVA
jgi:hypothetical protein